MMTEVSKLMDHQQATQLSAVEKYLLDELSPEMRDQFEEHFFDCEECASDLRATAGFMDAAKRELRARQVKVAAPVVAITPRATSLWPKVAVWAALAASLLVIVYQNVLVFPRARTEVSELRSPEILPSLSLMGGNSRGGNVPTLTVGAAKPFLLLLDIPTEDRFSSYNCQLYSPQGTLVWQVGVTAQAAKDTISMRVPSSGKQAGEYTLAVQGQGNQGNAGPVEIARLRFKLNSLD